MKKPADESVLADIPDLIATFEVIIDDLKSAETVEKQTDLRDNLVSAREALNLASRDLDALLKRVVMG